MRYQLTKLAEQFLDSCRQRFAEFTKEMRTKEEFDEVIDELNIKSDEKFREDTFEPEQIKSTV